MSDNYRALTRTYRPPTFDDIVSQNHVSDTLKNAIKQNRLAHAYMFCGPRGVGKTTMARVLARSVNNIEDDVDGESLNQTLNVIEIDAASNNGVDDIRDLRERVRIPPQNGRYKIYIIDEVHMLSKAAFNALLKTLEEPPDHVIFIFATTEPNKVLPTILSRVQRFDFKRISVDEMVGKLAEVAESEGVKIDRESLHVIAKKADGALRDALGLLDQSIAFCGTDIQHEELLRALNVVSTDRMFQFMETVETNDATRGLQLINKLLEDGYDIQEFLVGLTEHLRNLYVAKSSESMHLVEASDSTKKRYREAAEAFSEDDLMRMLHILSEAQFKVKEAHQPKIQFEITLLKLIHMERTKKLNTLIEELRQVKKNGSFSGAVDQSSPKSNGSVAEEETQPENQYEGTSVEEPGGESVSEEVESNPEEQPVRNGKLNDSPQPDPPYPEETDLSANDDNAGQLTQETDTELDNSEETDFQQSEEATSSVSDEEPDTEPDTNSNSLEHIFGSPSLGNGSTAVSDKKETKEETKTEKKAAPGSKSRTVSLENVKENWDDYVITLKDEVAQMLYFQMQRVEPIKLKNRELVLRCNDDFAKKMVEEHKRELAKILEGKVGGFLQFSCVVKKDEKKVESTMSPYERFKQLQEKDPQIKTLVELFGAELDYNLNQ